MKVEDAMTKRVATCLVSDFVSDAARLMDREGLGSLCVLADDGSGRLAGVLTDRDVCLAVARGESRLAELHVRALMSADLHVCHAGDELKQALLEIETCGRRRLPVVDDAGRLQGLLTLTDLAELAAGAQPAPISPAELCRVLVSCASRRREPEHLLLG